MPLPSLLRAPISARLRDAILAYQPTTYHPSDSVVSPLVDVARNWNATVTGSPTIAAAPDPIGRGITLSGTSQWGITSGSVPAPAASVSVIGFVSTTDASAAARALMARGAAAQHSWQLYLNSSHQATFEALQSGASSHCSAAIASSAINDGAWWMLAGTFDGTTLYTYRVSSTGVLSSATSTSLTSTWHKASTGGIGIGVRPSNGLPMIGSIAHLAHWADRLLTVSDIRYIASIAFGG
jgi:hypothetical protein